MSLVTVVVTSTSTPSPANQTYASTTLVLTDASGASQSLPAATLPDGTTGAAFTVTAPGAGNVVAQAADTTGAPMGASVSASFTIVAAAPPPPPATFPLPTGLTATVS